MGGIGRKAPSRRGGPFVLQGIVRAIRRDRGVVEASSDTLASDLARDFEEILILGR